MSLDLGCTAKDPVQALASALSLASLSSFRHRASVKLRYYREFVDINCLFAYCTKSIHELNEFNRLQLLDIIN